MNTTSENSHFSLAGACPNIQSTSKMCSEFFASFSLDADRLAFEGRRLELNRSDQIWFMAIRDLVGPERYPRISLLRQICHSTETAPFVCKTTASLAHCWTCFALLWLFYFFSCLTSRCKWLCSTNKNPRRVLLSLISFDSKVWKTLTRRAGARMKTEARLSIASVVYKRTQLSLTQAPAFSH